MKKIIQFIKPVIEFSPKLSIICRLIRDTLLTFEEPKKTPLGFKLSGNSSMQAGLFEEEETKIVKQILPNTDVFINIGANVGYYCCMACSFGKYVVAFEPIMQNVMHLLKNIKVNNYEENVEVFPLALGNKEGIIDIYGSGTGASIVKGWAGISHVYRRLIPISRADTVLRSRFKNCKCFVLADIEGAEKNMLEGASNLLCQNPKPIWMVEISITDHQPRDVSINPDLLSTFKIFWDNGYNAWTAKEKPRLIELKEIENIIKTGKDTICTHNFLFVDKYKKPDMLGCHLYKGSK